MQSIKRLVLTKNNCVWSVKQTTSSALKKQIIDIFHFKYFLNRLYKIAKFLYTIEVHTKMKREMINFTQKNKK